MGFDGSGGYNRLHNWVTDKNGAIKITASRMDAEFDDFASAMELCLTKDGQQNPTANLPMNSKKHTGVAPASARTEYLDGATYQDGGFVWAGLASGTSAIALTMNPTITAYTTGMRVGFIAVGDNASAVTINIDGVSAAAGVKGKNEALVATDIVSGGAYWITYKGADGWQFGNPLEENPTFVTLQTTGLATLGNVLCSGSAVFTSSLNVTGATNLTGDATLSGDVILTSAKQITTLTDEDLNLAPNGTGDLVLDGHKWPQADGNAGEYLTTDGAGQTSWKGWTNSGAITLSSGSPTSVSLGSSLSNVSEIEISVVSASTNTGATAPMIQIGDSGGLETTGYDGRANYQDAGQSLSDNNSTGWLVGDQANFNAADTLDFKITIKHMGSNVWAFDCYGTGAGSGIGVFSSIGHKTLTAALDRVTITTSAGTATFDSGTAYMRSR